MTGRELILYILKNNLENEVVLKNGLFIDFMDETQAAIKFNVGIATIKAWRKYGKRQNLKRSDIYDKEHGGIKIE